MEVFSTKDGKKEGGIEKKSVKHLNLLQHNNRGERVYSQKSGSRPIFDDPGSPHGSRPIFDDPGSPHGSRPIFDDPGSPHGSRPIFDDPASPHNSRPIFDDPASPHGSGPIFDDPGSPHSSGPIFDDPGSPHGSRPIFDDPASPHSSRPNYDDPGSPHSSRPNYDDPGSPHGSRPNYDDPGSLHDSGPIFDDLGSLHSSDFRTDGHDVEDKTDYKSIPLFNLDHYRRHLLDTDYELVPQQIDQALKQWEVYKKFLSDIHTHLSQADEFVMTWNIEEIQNIWNKGAEKLQQVSDPSEKQNIILDSMENINEQIKHLNDSLRFYNHLNEDILYNNTKCLNESSKEITGKYSYDHAQKVSVDREKQGETSNNPDSGFLADGRVSHSTPGYNGLNPFIDDYISHSIPEYNGLNPSIDDYILHSTPEYNGLNPSIGDHISHSTPRGETSINPDSSFLADGCDKAPKVLIDESRIEEHNNLILGLKKIHDNIKDSEVSKDYKKSLGVSIDSLDTLFHRCQQETTLENQRKSYKNYIGALQKFISENTIKEEDSLSHLADNPDPSFRVDGRVSHSTPRDETSINPDSSFLADDPGETPKVWMDEASVVEKHNKHISKLQETGEDKRYHNNLRRTWLCMSWNSKRTGGREQIHTSGTEALDLKPDLQDTNVIHPHKAKTKRWRHISSWLSKKDRSKSTEKSKDEIKSKSIFALGMLKRNKVGSGSKREAIASEDTSSRHGSV